MQLGGKPVPMVADSGDRQAIPQIIDVIEESAVPMPASALEQTTRYDPLAPSHRPPPRPEPAESASEGHDTDADHTLVDLTPLPPDELPFEDTSLAHSMPGLPPKRADTDELTFEELHSLVVSVEPSQGQVPAQKSPSRSQRPTTSRPWVVQATPPGADAEPTYPEQTAPEAIPANALEIISERIATERAPVIVGGRYQVLERIGAGGMGKVFKVVHTKLGKVFALKIISGALASESKVREQFYREARTASSLSHPNIASVVDYGEDSAVGAFMVMEFLSGEPLSVRLARKHRLDVATAAEIVGQMAEALDYIHNQGIVHCDIKTENILLTKLPGSKRSRMQAKLLDFGLARSTTSEHTTASVAGTPHYVAPERLRGDQPSPSNDIYGLGILFYELLTGRVPWDGTVDQILTGHLDLQPTAPSALIDGGIDPAVEALILRALAKHPSERHENVAAFLHELQTVTHALDHSLGYGRYDSRSGSGGTSIQPANARDRTARALFQASRIPMALLSSRGVILIANPAFARFIMGVAVDVEGRR
ncbi:MAG: serine/threonine-protein kinase, partial [Myxococcota bacterium]